MVERTLEFIKKLLSFASTDPSPSVSSLTALCPPHPRPTSAAPQMPRDQSICARCALCHLCPAKSYLFLKALFEHQLLRKAFLCPLRGFPSTRCLLLPWFITLYGNYLPRSHSIFPGCELLSSEYQCLHYAWNIGEAQ